MSSREIKFRAWETSPFGNQMRNVDLFFFEEEGIREVPEDTRNRYELMQYTGLKDREGKEIYEGDIVQSHKYGFNLIVKWCDGKGEDLGNQVGWCLDDGRYKVEFEAYLEVDDMQREEYANVSVLGNIYETPELIAEEDKS